MKNEKGITLIALVITIIVMLILVGVTINIAISGGLFDTARSAAGQTHAEKEKETLISAVFGTITSNGEVDLENIQLPADFTYDDETGLYQGPSGKQYQINPTTGEVKEYEGPIEVGKVYRISFKDTKTYTQEFFRRFVQSDGQVKFIVLYPTSYQDGAEAFANQDASLISIGNFDSNLFALYYSPDAAGTAMYCTKGDGKWYYIPDGEFGHAQESEAPTIGNKKIGTIEEQEAVGLPSFGSYSNMREIINIEEVTN